jgi:PAS domain S-box-containing protein
MSQTRKRHLPLQAYLLAVIILATLLAGGLSVYQQQLRTERAREAAASATGFVAKLGANDIAQAVKSAQDIVTGLAANPTLTALFETPTPQGCTLTFSGAGPFTSGHIDIVNRAGKTLCSSRELPDGEAYAGAGWLDATTARVVGPVDDSGEQALVILAPIQDLGVVATFLHLDPVPAHLEDLYRYGGATPVRFDLLLEDGTPITAVRGEQDAIAREAEVPTLGWTVRAGQVESEALDYANGVNRQITVFLIIALLFVAALTQLIYLGIARPIRRLSSSVRIATAGNGTIEPPTSGPAEVVSLGQDFSALTQNLAAELAHRQRAESEAKTSEASYRTMFEANPQPVWVHHTETGSLMAVNAAMVETFGWSREQLLTMGYEDLLGDSSADLKDALGGSEGVKRSGPWPLSDRDGEKIDCLITSATLRLPDTPGRIVVAEDVTAQLHTERLLTRTQRMDSLGQLAGGIAHDFNNLLAVMLNYADFAAQEVSTAAEEDPTRWTQVLSDVREIVTAGGRAAALTRQLLSFARGDSLETHPVNMNEVANGIEHLLRRTLGEHVSLEFSLKSDLWPVDANVGQLEQVIVNLAVNARDAMPDGGRLSIETLNVDVDDEYAASRPERPPGRYVRLRVSDTGVGMDAQARDRAFEPFFTTKDRATGTGLGLATVYGIVKRAGGTIDIYSEPGLGTTISMFLPVAHSHAGAAPEPRTENHRTSGSEMILVVEDDEALRLLTERILGRDGYRVLTAEDGPTAEVIAEQHRGEIDLLLTDMVMPGMLGSELAHRVTDADPSVSVLFMSGYAPPVLVNGGSLPSNAATVDKPFSADLLLGKIRQVLDAQTAPPARPADERLG